ncbi:hypothetical protein HU200_031176 [Digitaria exilis]|uniref:Uncharacterized protein n=1 Tax=Digitaria exilis TaxID=1010633 RepID=A0A835BRA8_9POAL|nr:hypothetical protein HU200_031176 [Digitaria exilis]
MGDSGPGAGDRGGTRKPSATSPVACSAPPWSASRRRCRRTTTDARGRGSSASSSWPRTSASPPPRRRWRRPRSSRYAAPRPARRTRSPPSPTSPTPTRPSGALWGCSGEPWSTPRPRWCCDRLLTAYNLLDHPDLPGVDCFVDAEREAAQVCLDAAENIAGVSAAYAYTALCVLFPG